MAKKIKDKAALAEIERLKSELETANQANERVKTLEAKLDLIERAVEKSLKSGKLAKANSRTNSTTVVSAELPGDIEVNPKDKLNTTPTNGIRKGFFSNANLFMREMSGTLFKSKMFWSLLVILPLLLTFVDYSVFATIGSANVKLSRYVSDGDIIYNIDYTKAGYAGVSMDMINYFILSPLLLSSLIIFPSYISKSRENNTLKRQAMIGVTRKQTYYYYTTFSITFLVLFALFWFGPWTMVLDWLVKSMFPDLMGIQGPVGHGASSVDYREITLILGWGDNLPDIINNNPDLTEGLSGIINIDGWKEYLNGDTSQLENLILGLGLIFNKASEEMIPGSSFLEAIFGLSNDAWEELNTTYLAAVSGGADKLLFPPLFEVFEFYKNWELMLVMVLISTIALNNYGYNKAMKSKSSSGMLGWGLGMWIFATFASASSMMMAVNIIDSTWSSLPFWNYFMMTLLFIVKWMFVVTLPSLMMNAIMIVGVGSVDYSALKFQVGEDLVLIDSDIVNSIRLAIVIVTILLSIWIVLSTFFKKTTLMSYESSR